MDRNYKLKIYEEGERRWYWKAMSLDGRTVIAASAKAFPSQYQAKRNADMAGYTEY